MVENTVVTKERKLFSILLKTVKKKYISKYIFSPYSDDEETWYNTTLLL